MRIEELTIRINLDSGSAVSGLKSLNTAFSGLGSRLTASFAGVFDTLRDVVASVGDLGVRLGSDIVAEAISLEDALAGVRKTANLSAEDVGQLAARVREYSTTALEGHVSAQQLAEALEIAGQQGIFAGKSLEEGSADGLAFAKAMNYASESFGGMRIGTIAEKLGILHGRFTDTIPTIENLVSTINHFGDSTKRSESYLTDLSGNLAEAAALTGLSEQATVALAASLGSVAQTAQKSGTAMSRILAKMRSESDAFALAFGLNADEFNRLVREDMEAALQVLANRLNELGGSQEGIDVILAGMKDLQLTGSGVSNVLLGLGAANEQLTQYLGESYVVWRENTSASDAFWNSMDRLSKVWEALGTIWQNTIGVIGDALLPHLKGLGQYVANLAGEFSAWFQQSRFVTEILPQAMERVKDLLQDLLDRAVKFVQHLDWSKVLEKVKAAWESVKATAITFYNFLFKANADGQTGFQRLLATVKDVAAGFKTVADFLGPVLKKVRDLGPLVEFMGKAWRLFGKGIEVVRDLTLPLFQSMVSLITALTDEGYTLKMAFQDIFASIGAAIKHTIGHVTDLGKKLLSLIPGMKSVGKEAYGESLFPDMIAYADQTAAAVSGIGASLEGVERKLASVSQGLAGLGFGGLDSNTLQSLSRSTGVFTAQGLGNLQRLARTNQTPLPQQAQTATPTAFPTQTGPIPVQLVGSAGVNFVIEGQETSKLAATITAEQRVQTDRVTSGFGGGGHGFS